MYVSGIAYNTCELLEVIDDLVTTKLGDDNWKKLHEVKASYRGEEKLCEVVWEGKGDGTDKIFIQMRVPYELGEVYNKVTSPNLIALDALAGFDSGLDYFEQAGSIQQWLGSIGTTKVNQPIFTTALDNRFAYWVFANSQRIVVVVKMSTVYESMYVGFINPISSEKQYPYPMYVAGNGNMLGAVWGGNVQGSFISPYNGSGYLRRADGSWRSFDALLSSTPPNPFSVGTLFPYNTGNQKLVPNYYEGAVGDLDNALMMPIMLCTTQPYDINGILDDVYFISGTRDIASEQIMTFGSEQYIVFAKKDSLNPNTYFSVKLK